MGDLFALAPWLETLRDTSAVIAVLAGTVVSVSAAIRVPVISRPLRWVGRTLFADPFEKWLDRVIGNHVTGVRETLDSTAAKVENIDDRLEAIEHEVLPNDGSSLRDAVSRTESRCDRIDAELARLLPLYAPRPQS